MPTQNKIQSSEDPSVETPIKYPAKPLEKTQAKPLEETQAKPLEETLTKSLIKSQAKPQAKSQAKPLTKSQAKPLGRSSRKSNRRSTHRKKSRANGRKFSVKSRVFNKRDIQKVEAKIKEIRGKKTDDIRSELKKQGIHISGKSNRLLKDIYLYSKMCNVNIQYEK